MVAQLWNSDCWMATLQWGIIGTYKKFVSKNRAGWGNAISIGKSQYTNPDFALYRLISNTQLNEVQCVSQTLRELGSANACACFFSSETFSWHCWQRLLSDSEMVTDPAPSGAGRLLHRASSTEWSLFLGFRSRANGDSPLGHPSTLSIRKQFSYNCSR